MGANGTRRPHPGQQSHYERHHIDGNGIATLSDNSTIITGSFGGLAVFGPNESNETILFSSYPHTMFIAHYNTDGTLAWVKESSIGGDDTCGGNIFALSDNSTIITGFFSGSETFGEGESEETTLVSFGGIDFFLARYNPDGTLSWIKQAGGVDDDTGGPVTVLSDNSIIMAGTYGFADGEPATFGPGEPGETILSSFGHADIFIAGYNSDGTLKWAKHAGSSGWDDGYGITSLSDDSCVVTGRYKDNATFGPGEFNETILISSGNWDIFVAHFAP